MGASGYYYVYLINWVILPCDVLLLFTFPCFPQGYLSVVNDGCVHVGDRIQLCNPAAADRTKYFANIDPRDESCLSVNISAAQLLEEKRIAGTCQISSSINHTKPVARNVFVTERCVYSDRLLVK